MDSKSSADPLPVYVTAVPVPPPNPPYSSNDIRSNLNREKSSYDLPAGGRTSVIDENTVNKLVAQGFTKGLAKSLCSTKLSFPLRIWVVDNSGSMQIADGYRIVPTKEKNDLKVVPCTRWVELKETINYHIQMSAMLSTPTTFRLLNDPGITVGHQQFSVAENSDDIITLMKESQEAMSIMNKTRPSGVTPLISHILEIQASVMEMSPKLIKEGKRVAIILATDGLPSDDYGAFSELIRQQFIEALRLLEGLPIWLVIRLCTDEDEVVEFYNNLDSELELSIDVIDDFVGEATEIYKFNPWLNYALPLHRMREMGFHDRLFDSLDERALSVGEVRDFVTLLFGQENIDGLADPEVDFVGFMNDMKRLVDNESQEWNPMKNKLCPWVDLKRLNKQYGSQSSSSCTCM